MGRFRNYIYTTPGLDCFYKLQLAGKNYVYCLQHDYEKTPLSSTLCHLSSSFILYPSISHSLSSTPPFLILYPIHLHPSSFILYPSIPHSLSYTSPSLLLYPIHLHPSFFNLYPSLLPRFVNYVKFKVDQKCFVFF